MPSDSALTTRRLFLAASATAGAFSFVTPAPADGMDLAAEQTGGAGGADSTSIRPFSYKASDAALADLRRRVEATRWPERELVSDATQGVQLATTRKLAQYWAGDYDWRKV